MKGFCSGSTPCWFRLMTSLDPRDGNKGPFFVRWCWLTQPITIRNSHTRVATPSGIKRNNIYLLKKLFIMWSKSYAYACGQLNYRIFKNVVRGRERRMIAVNDKTSTHHNRSRNSRVIRVPSRLHGAAGAGQVANQVLRVILSVERMLNPLAICNGKYIFFFLIDKKMSPYCKMTYRFSIPHMLRSHWLKSVV